MNTLEKFQGVMEYHFSSKCAELEAFSATGYSFEEWFNWELFYALKSSGSGLRPKPAYKDYGLGGSSKTGDVAFDHQGKTYLVEVALVHDYTQNKWLEKIRRDREQLVTLREAKDVVPVQLIVMVSEYKEIVEKESWSAWLEFLDFWGDSKSVDIKLRLPKNGQAWIVGWDL